MTNKQKIEQILPYLDKILPNAECELSYSKDYELVIAVMLSAQTTDKAVNEVTKKLFQKFPSLLSLSTASFDEVSSIIKTIGMYKVKTNNVIGIAQKLIQDFNGKLPNDKLLLQTLPGIGNKSAGVIRAEIFHIPDLAVDTHILRLSKRWKIVNQNANPIKTEQTLKKLIPQDRWIKAHHQLIHFGRYFCKAKKPKCENCPLNNICHSN